MATPDARAADIVAAGAVVTLESGEVLLVHRPKYDDWSFPKGKVDPGEHVVTAAVREVAEETGLTIRLGVRLGSQRYLVADGLRRTKDVHYWVGHVVGDSDVTAYLPNEEIDHVGWFAPEEAARRLSYPRDRATLAECSRSRDDAYPLLVLRHGRAQDRGAWRGDDRHRTLAPAGELQAGQLVPVLAAYGVARVVTSDSTRCRQTVDPYAAAYQLPVEATPDLSEEDATRTSVREHVAGLLDRRVPAVLCSHRRVLPWVSDALGLEPRELAPGELLVAHRRRDRVVAFEVHQPT